MPRRKQPTSLFEMCIKTSGINIMSACEVIHKRYFPDCETSECQREIRSVQSYLMSIIPAKLFDVFHSRRNDIIIYDRHTCVDVHLFTSVLMCPNMTVLQLHPIEVSDNDFRIKLGQFWTDNLPKLTQLVVLDLRNICTNEILQIISENCPLLEEFHAVSGDYVRDIYLSIGGLYYLRKLKQLRILEIVGYIEEDNVLYGCIPLDGIIALIEELPNLEELKVPDVNYYPITNPIANGSSRDIGPFPIKSITFSLNSYMVDCTTLATVCPLLNELTLQTSNLSFPYSTIEKLCDTNLELSKLNLKNFYITVTILALKCKGFYLTQLSLGESGSINFDNLLSIGEYCPHLQNLCIRSQLNLSVPRGYRQTNNIFSKLKKLELGYNNFCIKSIISFFAKCSSYLQSMKINICYILLEVDEMLTFLLNNGHLENIEELWLSGYLIMSKDVIISLINRCEKLRILAYGVDCIENAKIIKVDVDNYIKDNNLDLEIINSLYYFNTKTSLYNTILALIRTST